MNAILKKLAWLVLIAPAIYLALTWNNLPERIAMQYDLQGQPTRFGDRTELMGMVILLTIVDIFIYLLLPNVYRIDPKKYAAENKDRLYRITFAIIVFMAALQCLIIFYATRSNIELKMNFIFAGVGLLFAIIGNYMPNLKPNYFAGLRLPWTLESEDNWRRTHHMAGKLWFVGGLLLAVTCLFISSRSSGIVFIIVTSIIILIPCVYSYRIYKKRNALN